MAAGAGEVHAVTAEELAMPLSGAAPVDEMGALPTLDPRLERCIDEDEKDEQRRHEILASIGRIVIGRMQAPPWTVATTMVSSDP